MSKRDLMKYLKKPYSLFLFVAVIFLLVYLFYGNDSIDIQMDGTYYTLMTRRPLLLMTIEFSLAWLVYIVAERYLFSKALTWLHVTGTILLVMVIHAYQSQSGIIGRILRIEHFSRRSLKEYEYYVAPYSGILLLALTLLQGVFIYNVLKGRKKLVHYGR